jgi:hypothetical protein
MKSAEETFGHESGDEDDTDEELGNSPLQVVASKAKNFRSGGRYKKAIERLGEMIESDEKPLGVLNGQAVNSVGKNTIGVAAVTDKRLLYYGRLQFQEAIEQFPLDKVDSVQESAGMAMAGFSASVPGSTFTLKKANKIGAKSFVEILRKAIADYQPATSSDKSQPTDGPLDKLKKLAELHAVGVLSDEEFALKKAELLEQI